jgi:plastocyanin
MKALKHAPSFIKQNIFLAGLVLFVFAITFTALFLYASNKKTTQSVTAAPCPVAACVSIGSDAANPNILTVTKDSYVQFNSADGRKHNIALSHSAAHHDDPTRYESGDFQADEAWKVQFKKDGAYSFRDKYNESVKVDVIVYTEGKDYKVE